MCIANVKKTVYETFVDSNILFLIAKPQNKQQFLRLSNLHFEKNRFISKENFSLTFILCMCVFQI